MLKESMGVRVSKIYGQKTLILSNKLGMNDRELAIKEELNFIVIPLVRQPTENEWEEMQTQVPDMQLTTDSFEEKGPRKKTLAEILSNELPSNLLDKLPRALDNIGDIAVVEIPIELQSFKSLIGNSILKTHKNVKTVLAKGGAIDGTYRLRQFEIIAGEHKTNTIHKEYGCQFYADIAKAYFSPRLSHEHERVASLVQIGETVVDLFAGIGPFSVLIAKKQIEAKVYAIDINPDAVEFLKRNTRLNRVENRVFPILGDARQIVDQKLVGVADRVIMNLPKKAVEFVDVACKAIKPSGGIAHYYGFMRLPDSMESTKKKLAELVAISGRTIDKFLTAKTVRETAPFEWQIVLDAIIL
jgi:tRNA (guanine37-N1)-methyltransferase